MGTTNFSLAAFGAAGTGLASAEGRIPQKSDSIVSASEEAGAALSCSAGQTGQAERVAATVATVLERAADLSEQRPRDRRRAPLTKEAGAAQLSGEGKRAFSEGCQSDGLPQKRQKTGKLTISSLPPTALEAIFPFMKLKDQKALSMTCRTLRMRFQAFYQPRCQALLAADACQHLLTQFDINCPEGGAASPAQMEAMVSRVGQVLEATKGVLRRFPRCSLPKNTAEELVLEAPPRDLRGLLKLAYRFNLVHLFGSCRTTQTAWESFSGSCTDEASLKEFAQVLQAWVSTAEAEETTRFCVQSAECMCIPTEIGRLAQLRSLDLSNDSLSIVPAAVGQLANLEELYLYSNQIRTISEQVGQLRNLKTLGLNANRLTTLPAKIGQLESLTTLSLGLNRLAEVPEAVWRLLKLEHLDLSGNQLSEVSAKACQLVALRHLDLSNNQLLELPPTFWQLEKLAVLRLDNNRLTTISAGVGRLTNLHVLAVPRNQLSLFPPDVGRLVNLVTLDLCGNFLKTLPLEIGQLTGLKQLLVAGNPLGEMPKEISGPLRQAGTTIFARSPSGLC